MSLPPSNTPNITPLEAVLRDACARALAPMVSLKLTMIWFRSVTALARSLREMQADAGQPRGFAPDMIALLQAVHAQACQLALDPALPAPAVGSLHRAIAALGRAAHLAHPAPVKHRQKPAAKQALQPEAVPTPQPVARRPLPPRVLSELDAVIAEASGRGGKDYKAPGVALSALSPLSYRPRP